MNYDIQEIPISKIFNDTNFNCRGHITPLDVKDLADDIRDNGLQFPIAVQPRFDVTDLDEEYDFRIIAGHRRYMAHKILGLETIPAMVRSGLTEVEARLMNLSENLKRKELNIKQEAEAVRHLRMLLLTQEDIASKLGQSRTWVQIRLHLLRLPEEIQDEAAAGFLNQTHIRQLHAMKDKDSQFDAVRKIKVAKEKGNGAVIIGKKPQEDPDKAKRQNPKAVRDLMAIFASQGFHGLHLRCLAWTNGAITTRALFEDIRVEAVRAGIEVTLPELAEPVTRVNSTRKAERLSK